MSYSKLIILIVVCIFSFNLVGCEDEKKPVTAKEIVKELRENEKQHKKDPGSIKDLPEMNIF